MSLINRRILPLVLLCALTFSLLAVSPAIPNAHAVAPTALSIKPTTVPLAAAGSTVTLQVNVTNAPSTSGIDIYVSLGASAQSILNPTTITLGTAIPMPFELSHCINNTGSGCDANDGPGIVHDAFTSLSGASAAGNFTLFTISYTAVAGPGTSVFFKGTTGNPETVTINNGLNSLFDPSGFNITGIPEQPATYGLPPQPDFTVSTGAVSPASILATNSGTSTITVSSVQGFSGPVALTSNPSLGLSCPAIPSVNVPSGGSATASLTCSAATGADYTATVTGTSGTLSHTSTPAVTFHVVDFSISCAPVTTLATVTGSTTCTVTAINGFTGTVAFALSSGFTPPPGCTVTSSGATVSVVCPTAPAPFTVPVTGTTGTAPATLSRSTSFTATVQDFTPSCPGITTLATIAGSSTCAATGINGFSGTVTWAVSSGFLFPTGCSGSFTGAVLSVTCSTGVAPFTVPVTGSSGGLSRSTTVSVTVQDFSIAGPPITTLATVPGTSTVAVTSINGFGGAVTFAISSGFTFPTGCSGSFAGAVLSVTCATGVAPFTVPVTGTSGGLSRSTTVSVTVRDFSLSAPPITTLATVAGTSTVSVTGINGFTGAVTFTISSGFTFPTGCSGSFSGAVLSVTCATGVTPFSVPITGTTGAAPNTLSRSTSVNPVTVQDFTPSCTAITPLATVAGTSTCVATGINGFSGAVTWAIGSGFTFPAGCNGSFAGAVLSVTCATGVPGFSVPVTASSGGLSRSTSAAVTVRDFSLSAPGISLTTPGVAGTSLIVVTAINGFTGTINYAVTSTQPTGCAASVSAAGLISVTCSPLPSASFTVTVTGTAAAASTLSRAVNGAAGVSVNVNGFSLTITPPSPTSITTLATVAGTSIITVTPIGTFSGTVNLAATGAPVACTVTLPANVVLPPAKTATLSVTCPTGTTGTFTVVVTGTSGTLPPSVVSIPVTIQDFTLSAPAITLTTAGVAGTSQIVVTAINGFTGTINYAVTSTQPTGCAASVSAAGLISVTCSPLPSASFTVTVTGTAAAASTLSRAVNGAAGVMVSTNTFTVSLGLVSPASVLATQSGSSVVTVQSIGTFAGLVTLTANPSSPNLVCQPVTSVTLVAGGIVTRTLTCSSTIAVDYTATVTGVGGSPAQTITSTSVTFHIVDFTPSCPAITTLATVTGSSTCATTAVNGFSGAVTWAVSSGFVFPTNCNGSFIGAVLSVTCSTGVTPFSVPVTASSGGLSRITSVNPVTVQDFTPSCTAITPLATVAGTSTCVATGINGFSGAVTWAVSSGFVFPTNCNGSFIGAVLSVTCSTGVTPFSVPVTASSGGLSRSTTVSVTVRDFSLAAPGITLTAAGVAGTSQIVVTAINGFTGTINYAVTNSASLPAGCTANVSTTGLISVTCSPLPTASFPFTVTVTGTAAAASTLSRAVNGAAGVSVSGPNVSFAITTSQTSIGPLVTSFQDPDGTPEGPLVGETLISVIASGGFTGTVTLSLTIPANLDAVLNATSITFVPGGHTVINATLDVDSAAAANYSIMVTASSTGLPSKSLNVAVLVVDFGITANPSIGPLVPASGQTGSTPYTVTAQNGASAAISLSVSGACFIAAGVITCPSSGTDATATPGSCTLSASGPCTGSVTVTVPNVHGPFALSIHATAAKFAFNAGDLGTGTIIVDRTFTTFLHVPDFDLSAADNGNVGPINLGPPGATNTITVAARDGFAGTVTFNLLVQNGTGFPTTGLTATIFPTSLTFGPASSLCTDPRGCPRFLSTTLTVVISQLGEYHVIVTGISTPYPNHLVGPNGFVFVFTPQLVVFIKPVIVPTQLAGSTFTEEIRSISLASYSGYDISVRTGTPGVLLADSIDVTGSILGGGTATFFETVNCVNNGFRADGTAILSGSPGNVGCGPTDGPGIAHSAGTTTTSLSAAGDGLLFRVHYVVAPGADFTVTASPNMVGITQGGAAGTSTITVQTGSFTNIGVFADSVFDASTGAPIDHGSRTAVYGAFNATLQLTAGQGLVANILPSLLKLDTFNNPLSAQLSVSFPTGITCPSLPLTILIDAVPTASTGLPTHRATVTVTVTQCQNPTFTVSASPTVIYLDGGSGTSTITVTGLLTFTGTVCLAQSGANVLSPSISPTCVTISVPQTQASATLTFAAIEGQTPSGTYHIFVTGTSGGIIVPLTFPVTPGYVTVIVLSNGVKFQMNATNPGEPHAVHISSGGVETWTATLTNRLTTTQYALVSITVVSSTGTHSFTLTSQVVAIAPGQTVTVTLTHTFTIADTPLTFQWNALLRFGATAANLDQVAVPFRHGSFEVEP